MLNLLGAVAEFERPLIRERQAEGDCSCKGTRSLQGRPAALDESQTQKLNNLAAVGVPKSKIAEQLGISRATVYRYLQVADRALSNTKT